MILIYTHKHSKALRQMCDYISQNIDIEIQISEITETQNHEQFSQVIQYLENPTEHKPGYWIPNSHFLDSFDIPIKVGPVNFPKNQILDNAAHQLANILRISPNPYPISSHETSIRYTYFPIPSDFGFDFFAHLYTCLHAIEETKIQQNQRDQFNRVKSSDLLSVQSGMHLLPMVDISIDYFCEKLNIPHSKPKFEIIPTADVDQCFQFKGKSILQFIGGALLHPSTIKDRILFLLTKKDKFQPSKTLESYLKSNNLSRIFWLNPKYNHPFIKNEIIKSSNYAKIGFHPNLLETQNSSPISQWQIELDNLKQIAGKNSITHSRQHYISMKLPETYMFLRDLNITDDWSMGYYDTIGFRAGTARNFPYFLDNNSFITVHPFQIMDVTCKFYLNLKSFQAIILGDLFKQIIEECGGQFCFIVHNESLSKTQGWKQWNSTFISWANANESIK